jgi:Cu/Ag efflux pump CusA
MPLGQLAEITLAEGPAQISREQIQRRTVVEANVRHAERWASREGTSCRSRSSGEHAHTGLT